LVSPSPSSLRARVGIFWHLLEYATETPSPLERPFHLAIGILLLSGVFWTTWGWFSKDRKRRYGPGNPILPIPRFEKRFLYDPAQDNIKRVVDYVTGLCRQHVFSARMVACVVCRVILLRGVMLNVQCSIDGVEVERTTNAVSIMPLTDHRYFSLSSSPFTKPPARVGHS